MLGAIPALPQYAFMAWCLVKNKNIGKNLPLPYIRKVNIISKYINIHSTFFASLLLCNFNIHILQI
jgi:hypothetical protein